MAKIVCIAGATYREGINNIGDIISMYSDNVELGDSYSTFEVIEINASDGEVTPAGLSALLPSSEEVENKYTNKIINSTPEILETLKSGSLTKAELEIYLSNIMVNP